MLLGMAVAGGLSSRQVTSKRTEKNEKNEKQKKKGLGKAVLSTYIHGEGWPSIQARGR